jgi:threonine/homoserine/homoserine lactone efflux protein
MPETQQVLMFMLAGVLLNLTPGPDVLYIVNQSLRGGVQRGLVAAWGITAGCFLHVAAAALGLGVVLATSADAFNLIKWMGAAYLVWMGGRLLWRTSSAHGDGAMAQEQSVMDHSGRHLYGPASKEMTGLLAVFFGAFATNALNPKVALFFWPLCRNSSRRRRLTRPGLLCSWAACSISTVCWCAWAGPWPPLGWLAGPKACSASCTTWTGWPACCLSALA